MDGDFFSLFPRDIDKKIYSLTHVKHTPFQKTKNINNFNNNSILDVDVDDIKKKIENDVIKYIPNFKKKYIYKSYFTSYKCKLLSNNDSRDCVIEQNNNIINVNCGKIIGIFELENFITNNLELL